MNAKKPTRARRIIPGLIFILAWLLVGWPGARSGGKLGRACRSLTRRPGIGRRAGFYWGWVWVGIPS